MPKITGLDLNELHSLLSLTTFPYLGPIKIRLLIKYFGSAQQALEAKKEELQLLPGFGPKIVDNWEITKNRKLWWKEIELAERTNTKLISWTDPSYPKRLLDIIDSPVLLYVRGQIKPKDDQAISIVGTRTPTIYGLETAEKFSYELAHEGFTIISGLARGIDTSAHRAALKSGRSIAVIGSGLADIYPRENLHLAEAISHAGALISEFPMTTPPDKQNFPQRNRIVSAMSLGVLLIEAPLKSGAMITMNKAYEQKRRLFAIPGRIDTAFEGNHALIKSDRARLVETPRDIIECFQNLFDVNYIKPQENRCSFEPEEVDLLKHFPLEELNLDELSYRVKIPIAKLNVLLMSLMLKKAIKEYPGKIYKKVSY